MPYNECMSTNKKAKGSGGRTIVLNRRARHDYFIQDTYEGGIALQGWEVKSLRQGRAQVQEGYVVLRDGEAYLLGAHINPLASASTHITPEPTRTRKLLLHRKELARLIGSVEQQGFTLVPLSLYWKHGLAKLEFGLAKGKKKHDKREATKDRDWARRKEQLMKH